MSQNNVDFSSTLSINDIILGAWRQRMTAFWVFVTLTVLCAVVLLILPNRYVSNAQLLVRLGPNSVAMDPTTDLSKTVSLQESRLNQVNSVAELLNSRTMVERVVDRVGAERILEPIGILPRWMSYITSILPEKPPRIEAGYTEEEVDHLINLGEACEAIESDYYAAPSKEAYTINIEFVSNSPFLSRDVVATFVDEYPKYHVDAHQATGSIEFFRKEADDSKAAAKDAADKLSTMKNENGIVEIGSAKSSLQTRMVETQRGLNTVIADLAAVQAELDSLETEMESMPARIDSEKLTGVFKHSGDLMRDKLFGLEIEEKELSTKFKSDHPKMLALQTQLAAARKIADKEFGQEPQILDVVNPNLQEMDLAFRNAIARQAGLKAKKAALDKQFTTVKAELIQLNDLELSLKNLTWDANVAESTHLTTATRLANAEQIASLEKLSMNDVSVAQPATLQVKKVGPKRGLLGAVGLFLSGLMAIAIAAAKDSQSAPRVSDSNEESNFDQPLPPRGADVLVPADSYVQSGSIVAGSGVTPKNPR